MVAGGENRVEPRQGRPGFWATYVGPQEPVVVELPRLASLGLRSVAAEFKHSTAQYHVSASLFVQVGGKPMKVKLASLRSGLADPGKGGVIEVVDHQPLNHTFTYEDGKLCFSIDGEIKQVAGSSDPPPAVMLHLTGYVFYDPLDGTATPEDLAAGAEPYL